VVALVVVRPVVARAEVLPVVARADVFPVDARLWLIEPLVAGPERLTDADVRAEVPEYFLEEPPPRRASASAAANSSTNTAVSINAEGRRPEGPVCRYAVVMRFITHLLRRRRSA
jgi:hypothetical protein